MWPVGYTAILVGGSRVEITLAASGQAAVTMDDSPGGDTGILHFAWGMLTRGPAVAGALPAFWNVATFQPPALEPAPATWRIIGTAGRLDVDVAIATWLQGPHGAPVLLELHTYSYPAGPPGGITRTWSAGDAYSVTFGALVLARRDADGVLVWIASERTRVA